jgi:transposase InsO family protein
VKFAFIDEEKAHFSISFMCRELEVSRSGYYAWCTRPESRRAERDRSLVPLIHAEFRKYPRGCGSRPVMHALRDAGACVSRKRVVRLMAQERLRHRLKRRFVVTTESHHVNPTAPNLLRRCFAVGAPNLAWASDITYLPTRRGWAYLAAILDVGSRKVVGWNVGPRLDEKLTLTALRLAIEERRPAHGMLHHSDRGVQYASHAYRALLAEHAIVCSMSRKGNCWDNALVESFFSSLKRELPNDDFADWRDAERAVFDYVAAHYNSHRRHSALGYVTPNEYERMSAT